MSRERVLDVVGLICRLVLGGVLVSAGVLKLMDLTGSVQSVVAYELVGYDLAQVIGTMLPVVEVAVGLLLLLGLFTRPAAIVAILLMVVFIAGIASAWARGLSIDCGCFGTGGKVAEGQAAYLPEILRDIGLAAAGLFLTLRSYTPFSLDRLFTQKGGD